MKYILKDKNKKVISEYRTRGEAEQGFSENPDSHIEISLEEHEAAILSESKRLVDLDLSLEKKQTELVSILDDSEKRIERLRGELQRMTQSKTSGLGYLEQKLAKANDVFLGEYSDVIYDIRN